MKKLTVFLLLLYSWQTYGQLVANIMLPPAGVVQKQQLWNILVTNLGSTTLSVFVQVTMTEATTGQSVMSATTGRISLSPGTKQFSAMNVGPVQYVPMSGSYQIDPSPAGLLPIGTFNVCYNFHVDGGKLLARECQFLDIQPLQPLLLSFPENHAVLDNKNPAFAWIPLSGIQSLPNLTYSMKLVEIFSGQSAAEALQKNIPLYTARHLTTNNLFYAPNAPVLNEKKSYGWQVSAFNSETEVVKSEIWDFSFEEKDGVKRKHSAAFVKLKKDPEESGYSQAYGRIRFEYFNETADTTWNVTITDITTATSRRIRVASLDTAKMSRGENLVDIAGPEVTGFVDKHLYLLRLRNSRNEIWQLKFEYRKEDE